MKKLLVLSVLFAETVCKAQFYQDTKTFGSFSEDGEQGTSVITDNSGNLYVTVFFRDTVDFGVENSYNFTELSFNGTFTAFNFALWK